MNQTLYSIFSSLPFALCLFWWIILLPRRGTVSSPAHRYLSIFALACMLLYFCHAAFFTGEETPVLRVLYFVCNLSVYPIFWLYVRSLTEPELPKIGAWWVMVPGPVAGVALTVVYLCGGDVAVLDIPFRVAFVLELNPNHPVFAKLATLSDADRKEYAELIYQQARLMAGLPLEDPAAFSELICRFM